MKILIATALLLFSWKTDFGQSLDSALYVAINAARSAGRQLAYDSSRQQPLDSYVAKDAFKRMRHSGMNCDGEILAKSWNPNDFIELWLHSKSHRRILRDKAYKSMVCKVVEVNKGNYIAIAQFFTSLPKEHKSK